MFFHSTSKAVEALAAAAAAAALAATKHTLVSRDNFTSHDFIFTDFTTDNAWHEFDLSSIIPAGTVGVFVIGDVQHSTSGKYLDLRKKGVSNDATVARCKTQVGGEGCGYQFMVAVSSDRKIEYRCSGAVTWQNLNLAVIAWVV